MRGPTAAVFGVILVATAATVQAQPSQSPPMLPAPTTEQLATNCLISGLLFATITTIGIIKPITMVSPSMSPLALLHEGIYGCGIGAATGFAMQPLMSYLISQMPPPPPMPPQGKPAADAQAILSAIPGQAR